MHCLVGGAPLRAAIDYGARMERPVVRSVLSSVCSVLLLAACTGSQPDPMPSKPAPAVPSGPVFVAAPGWDGPAVTAARAGNDAPLVVRIAAPTPGYTFTIDAVVVKDGAREVQATLLQPAADVVLAQVVTEIELSIEAGKLAGKEPLAVAVRRMQVGCHYFAPPPWLRALVQQP